MGSLGSRRRAATGASSRPRASLTDRDLAYLTEVDQWQRRGVATALLDRLVGRARATGITHFLALVLDENREALVLLEHRVPAGASRRRSASGPLELLIELPDPGALRGSTLGRVLRTVAQTPIVVNPYGVMREAIRRLRRS
jgi:hypothetical protein